MTRKPPLLEVVIFVAGVFAAAGASVYGYRTVGLYGDGAFASGYHRETDPKTGQSMLVHEVNTSKGRVRRVADNALRVREIRIDVDGDGVMESGVQMDEARPGGTAADQNKNGKFDTWGYYEAGRLTRAELDLDENGRIERWEHFGPGNRLEKVGSSSKDDGVEDTWSYPDAGGLLVKEEFDTDRDGRVDKRQLYASPLGSPARRFLSVVELDLDASGRPERRLHYRADGSFERVEIVSR